MFELSVSGHFEAAHFLKSKPEGHAYRGVHGHSFQVELRVAGRVEPGHGWVSDLADVKAALAAALAKLDHQLLNDIPGLETPTLERLCLWIAEDVRALIPAVSRIAVSRPSLNERCELVL